MNRCPWNIEAHGEISRGILSLMICTLINHPPPSCVINYLHLPRKIDPEELTPPRLTLTCTDSTRLHLIENRRARKGGESKLSFVVGVARLAVPRALSVSSLRVYTALLCLFFSPPYKVTEDTPSSSQKKKGVLNTEYIYVRFSIFSSPRQYVCKRVNTRYFEGRSVTGFAHKTIKKGGEAR